MQLKKRQNWEVGNTVNVGFVRGLEVLEKVASPSNGRPDGYVLLSPNAALYAFVPHAGGLSRVGSRYEAVEVITS